jgi:purine-cytosine permease-like protein
MRFFTHFSLFGLTWLAVVVFTINLVALNDANLYEAVNAVHNFLRGRYRAQTVAGLGIIGAVIAVFMQRSSSLQNNFFIVANMCAVFLPCATLVMAVDVFMLRYVSGCERKSGEYGAARAVVSWAEASAGNVLLGLREA